MSPEVLADMAHAGPASAAPSQDADDDVPIHPMTTLPPPYGAEIPRSCHPSVPGVVALTGRDIRSWTLRMAPPNSWPMLGYTAETHTQQ